MLRFCSKLTKLYYCKFKHQSECTAVIQIYNTDLETQLYDKKRYMATWLKRHMSKNQLKTIKNQHTIILHYDHTLVFNLSEITVHTCVTFMYMYMYPMSLCRSTCSDNILFPRKFIKTSEFCSPKIVGRKKENIQQTLITILKIICQLVI